MVELRVQLYVGACMDSVRGALLHCSNIAVVVVVVVAVVVIYLIFLSSFINIPELQGPRNYIILYLYLKKNSTDKP